MRKPAKPASRLKLAILAAGVQQKDIATEVGISEARLSQIVNGHWNADEGTWNDIARVICRDVDDIRPNTSRVAA